MNIEEKAKQYTINALDEIDEAVFDKMPVTTLFNSVCNAYKDGYKESLSEPSWQPISELPDIGTDSKICLMDRVGRCDCCDYGVSSDYVRKVKFRGFYHYFLILPDKPLK